MTKDPKTSNPAQALEYDDDSSFDWRKEFIALQYVIAEMRDEMRSAHRWREKRAHYSIFHEN